MSDWLRRCRASVEQETFKRLVEVFIDLVLLCVVEVYVHWPGDRAHFMAQAAI